jgi:hypothetical protein
MPEQAPSQNSAHSSGVDMQGTAIPDIGRSVERSYVINYA